MNLVRIKSTTSTNDYVLKYLPNGEDTIVISQSQTGGRGTKGRSFSSKKGGIYLTYLKYYDLEAARAFEIVADISVAVVKTLREFNVDAKIKWPNDIFVGGKKICGILTENKLIDGKIAYSIIGLGLNVNNKLPDELSEIATTMKKQIGKVDFEKVVERLVANLQLKAKTGQYVDYSCVLQQKVIVIESDKTIEAVVDEILADGRIKLDNDEILSSAEIKLKLKQ